MSTSAVEFLASGLRNSWLHDDDMSIYVRRGAHRIGDTVKKCFDVANINVDEKKRGRGLFTAWLAQTEIDAKAADMEAVFVESILNARLHLRLLNCGYKEVPNSYPISVYKELQ